MGRLAQARVEISGDDSRFQRAVRSFQSGTGRLNAAAISSGKTLSRAATGGIAAFSRLTSVIGGAAAVFGGFSVARAGLSTLTEFGTEISKVRALTGATGEEFASLEEQARSLGATTQFSASEAAAGMAFLAQAGFDVNDILEASPSFLNLAAAGGLELAEAMDIASNVMSGFGLAATESTRIADVLAKTAGSSNTNVLQLGEAFKSAGPVARQLGIGIEEVAAAVGQLGNVGIQGESAGTALRNIFLRLSAGGSEVESGLRSLNLTLKDISPATNSVSEIFRKFQEAVKDTGLAADETTAAFAKVFGTRAVAAGSSLVGLNAEIEDLNQNLLASTGAAENLAKVMIDNLAGDLKAAKSAFDELVLTVGDAGLTAALRNRTQDFTLFLRGLAGGGQVEDFISGIGRARNVIEEIAGPVLESFESRFANLTTFISSAFGGISGSEVFLDSLINGLGTANEFITEVSQRLNPAFESAGSAVNRIARALGQGADFVGDLVGQDLAGLFSDLDLDNFFSFENLDRVVAGIGTGFDAIASSGERFIEKMVNGFNFVRAAFRGGQLGDLLSDGLEAGFKKVANFGIRELSVAAIQVANLLNGAIFGAIKGGLDTGASLFDDLGNNLQSRLSGLGAAIGDSFQSGFSSVQSDLEKSNDTVLDISRNLSGGFLEAEDAARSFIDRLDSISDSLLTGIVNVAELGRNLFVLNLTEAFVNIAATGPALIFRAFEEGLERLGNTSIGKVLGLEDFEALSFDSVQSALADSLGSIARVDDLRADVTDSFNRSIGGFEGAFREVGGILSVGATAVEDFIKRLQDDADRQVFAINTGNGGFQFTGIEDAEQRFTNTLDSISRAADTFTLPTVEPDTSERDKALASEKKAIDAAAVGALNFSSKLNESSLALDNSLALGGTFAPSIDPDILSRNLDDPSLKKNLTNLSGSTDRLEDSIGSLESAISENSDAIEKRTLNADESIKARVNRQSQADIDKAGGAEAFEAALRKTSNLQDRRAPNTDISQSDLLSSRLDGPSPLDFLRDERITDISQSSLLEDKLGDSSDKLAAAAEKTTAASQSQEKAAGLTQSDDAAAKISGPLAKMTKSLAAIEKNTAKNAELSGLIKDLLDQRLPSETL